MNDKEKKTFLKSLNDRMLFRVCPIIGRNCVENCLCFKPAELLVNGDDSVAGAMNPECLHKDIDIHFYGE